MARNRSFCDLGALTPHQRMMDEVFRDFLREEGLRPISYYTQCPHSVSNMGMVNGLIRVDLTNEEAPQQIGIVITWSFK